MSANELFQKLKRSNEDRAKMIAAIRININDALASCAKLDESLEKFGESLDKASATIDIMEETLARRNQFYGQAPN
jgi:peptidoglycan hydrolase CwlO-like protein